LSNEAASSGALFAASFCNSTARALRVSNAGSGAGSGKPSVEFALQDGQVQVKK